MNTLKINTMKTIKLFIIALIGLTTFNSCSDDDAPVIVNEEEVITTLRLTLTPQGGGTPVVFLSQDLDGDGPNTPIVTSGNLMTSTTYNGVVQVLNELESPAENITLEVAEEDDEHQFFYNITGGAGNSISYADMDGNGNPIGILTTLTTGANATTNTMVVTLRHEPIKDAVGVSSGDITNAGGETDIEVSLQFSVN